MEVSDRSDIDLSRKPPDGTTCSKLILNFTVDELDLSSWGVVEAMDACPEIASGGSKVVIGRVKTLQAEEMTRITLGEC